MHQERFSVIIPTFRRTELLRKCLQSLAMQNYPREQFEVIVVDDGSETPPEQLVKEQQQSLNLRLVLQTHAGPAAARNRGAAEAKFDYLLFTDDDCFPSEDWLSGFAGRFTGRQIAGIGGRTLNALSQNPYSCASQLLIDYLYDYYHSRENPSRFFTSNNLGFPRKQFLDIGGFDSSFPRAAGEDREICYRWIHAGLPLFYAPEVQVFHSHSLNWKIFWKQHFNYGRGAYLYHRLRARKKLEPIRVEPSSFYWNLIRFPYKEQHEHASTLLAFLMGITQVANAAGFYWERLHAAGKS